MSEENDIQRLKDLVGDKVVASKEFRGESTVTVALDALHEVLGLCREILGFEMLLDVSSLDHTGEDPRFEMVYELATVDDSRHLRVKAKVAEDGEVPSSAGIWPGAEWHEREVWDMMGIGFSNHPNLKRILMWEGYPYHPLRKEFPLAGKATDMPDVAFSDEAPLEGGPFVTPTGAPNRVLGEPRAR